MRLLLGGGGHRPEDRRKALISEIKNFLGNIRSILFIPYAVKDHDEYEKAMLQLGFDAGYEFHSIHHTKHEYRAVESAEAIFVGGGNTFKLLYELQIKQILFDIKRAVLNGKPYIGVSAGSNIACPTIKTTNDMPIVQPPRGFEALGLVPFQINPHYVDANPNSSHQGETRETRIKEFHEMNEEVVVGLHEGAILRIEDRFVDLKGTAGAKIFARGTEPREYALGSQLNFLLS